MARRVDRTRLTDLGIRPRCSNSAFNHDPRPHDGGFILGDMLASRGAATQLQLATAAVRHEGVRSCEVVAENHESRQTRGRHDYTFG